MDWHNARAFCLAEGGDLASIHNQGENRAVATFAMANNAPRVWIGGNDLGVEVGLGGHRVMILLSLWQVFQVSLGTTRVDFRWPGGFCQICSYVM